MTRAGLAVAAAVALAGCDLVSGLAPAPPPAPRAPAADSRPALVGTIALPGGGSAHVLRVPIDAIEQTTCVAAVSNVGQVALTCAGPTVRLSD